MIQQSKKMNFPSIGPVLFKTSVRARHLSITIKQDKTVRVTIPHGRSLINAEKFFESKIPWVIKHLRRFERRKPTEHKIELPVVDRTKAKKALTERLNYLAGKHGYKYNKLFIRNQKTRWGTCSSKDNIGLNMNLHSLAPELQDYVILHELVHTRHKNHSKKFWAELDKLVGDSKELKKRLRKYKLAGV
jgi:predicted metal-dependent hydrolase